MLAAERSVCSRCSRPAMLMVRHNDDPAVPLCDHCALPYVSRITHHACDFAPFFLALAQPKANARTEFLPSAELEAAVCHECGLTFGEFAEIGLTGCAECYLTFRPVIVPALADLTSP